VHTEAKASCDQSDCNEANCGGQQCYERHEGVFAVLLDVLTIGRVRRNCSEDCWCNNGCTGFFSFYSS
jgi:hypothetical protein